MSRDKNELCPCGSEKKFGACCGPFLDGSKLPKTAEALMRSRYSAYACADVDYLYRTSSKAVQKEFDADNTKKWAESSEWTGLEVVNVEKGGERDDSGVLEFVAHYRVKGTMFNHHEIAEFTRGSEGQWVFEDGKILAPEPIRREEPKVGRNDVCPCGSGKKFKKCCGKA